MKRLIIILFILIIIGFSLGFYIKGSKNDITGNQIIGATVLTTSFVFFPLFLYYRRNKTKLKNFEVIPKKKDSHSEK